jgi:hypothetical protein
MELPKTMQLGRNLSRMLDPHRLSISMGEIIATLGVSTLAFAMPLPVSEDGPCVWTPPL